MEGPRGASSGSASTQLVQNAAATAREQKSGMCWMGMDEGWLGCSQNLLATHSPTLSCLSPSLTHYDSSILLALGSRAVGSLLITAVAALCSRAAVVDVASSALLHLIIPPKDARETIALSDALLDVIVFNIISSNSPTPAPNCLLRGPVQF